MKIKYLLIIFFIFILSCSNSENKNNSNNKVEIILSGEDNNIEIKKYNENELKELALDSLKKYIMNIIHILII